MFDMSQRHIYLATCAVDFRKSIDGLAMMVADALQANPGNGDIYVFYNKARNKVKVIYHDGTGFMLCYKRLDTGKLQMRTTPHDTHIQLDDQQLCWLLSGLDFMALKTVPKRYQYYQ